MRSYYEIYHYVLSSVELSSLENYRIILDECLLWYNMNDSEKYLMSLGEIKSTLDFDGYKSIASVVNNFMSYQVYLLKAENRSIRKI